MVIDPVSSVQLLSTYCFWEGIPLFSSCCLYLGEFTLNMLRLLLDWCKVLSFASMALKSIFCLSRFVNCFCSSFLLNREFKFIILGWVTCSSDCRIFILVFVFDGYLGAETSKILPGWVIPDLGVRLIDVSAVWVSLGYSMATSHLDSPPLVDWHPFL
jgi:hypothetical protein